MANNSTPTKSPDKKEKVYASEEEKFRDEHFHALALYERRKFVPRESLLHQIWVQNTSAYSSLKGFNHLFLVLCGFFVITHPFIYYNRTGELFNKRLYNTFKDEFFSVILLWPAFTLWSYHAFILQKLLLLGVPLFLLKIYQHLTQSLMFIFSIWLCLSKNWGLTHTCFILFQTVIHFFKMHSYTETNFLLREEALELKKRGLKPLSPYPHNVNLKDFTYYLCAPTLVYWHEYPKNDRIRWKRFFQLVVRVMFGLLAIYLIICEHFIPIIEKGHKTSVLDAVFQLSLPMLFFSLFIFFVIWESILNGFGELTRFADREFYLDWWNCTNYEEFNRKWNKIVHEFLYRHVYIYCLYVLKTSRFFAQLMTFLFSAVLHEFIVAVILREVKWILVGFMLFQIPLFKIMQWCQGKAIGNFIFWFGIILGVPLIFVLYIRENFNGWIFPS